MKSVSIESLLSLFIFSALSLLWLPDFLLLSYAWAGVLAICLLLLFGCFLCVQFPVSWKKYFVYALWLLCSLTYTHAHALKLLDQAEAIAGLPHQLETEIKVIELIHQQQYQAFIASAKLRSDLPEQRLYIQWKREEKVKLGESWRATLRLRTLSSRLNLGGFDRQQWYFSKRVTAWASVKHAVKTGDDFSWREKWLQRALAQTEGYSAQGLLIALAFGERAWLSATHWQVYQQTNTAHLIAISGLHIGLAMGIGFGLGRGVQYCLPTFRIRPHFPLCIGLLLALVYALLAGLTIPTQRALLALLFVVVIRLVRRYYTPWQLLLRVVALLCVYDPLMCLSSSFWLSLGAVCALLIWYQYFPLHLFYWRGNALAQQGGKIGSHVFALLHLQVGLMWLFTPMQLIMFGGMAWSALFANLIAVPVYTFLLVPLILFTVVSQNMFSSWWLVNWLVERVTQGLGSLHGHWVSVSQWHAMGITALLIIGFILALHYCYRQPASLSAPVIPLLRQKRWHLNPDRQLSSQQKKWATRCCLACLLGMAISAIEHWRTKPRWQLETLDVGQGLATLIVKEGRAILYDTGAAWRGGSMAQLEVIPYLQRQGLVLDKLILSHDDNDHSGGARQILTQYPQTELLMPSLKNYGKTDRTFCVRGRQWRWQGLDFKVLAPQHKVARAKNADSCVILISDGQYRILLTGDADVGVERKILSHLPLLDVLQVGHHGSKTSTSQALLTKTQPKIALISSGRWNPWGFPHHIVIERLAQVPSQIYNTAHTGQIRLEFGEKHVQVRTARTEFSPWYRRLIGLNTK